MDYVIFASEPKWVHEQPDRFLFTEVSDVYLILIRDYIITRGLVLMEHVYVILNSAIADRIVC